MKTIVINAIDGGDWIYSNDEWKNFINWEFDENFVIFGNSRMKSIQEARWWKTVQEIKSDIDCYYDDDGFRREYQGNYSEEQIEAIIKSYKEWDGNNEIKYLLKLLSIVFPNMEFEHTVLRGNAQGDWQECIYVQGVGVDENILSDFYFGNITEVTLEEDGEFIDSRIYSNTEFWNMEKGDLKKELLAAFGIGADEEVKFRQKTGYRQVSTYDDL